MSKVTLEAVNRSQKETAYGIKTQIGIKISETSIKDVNGNDIIVADRWLNTFTTKGTESWDKGMSVNIDVIEKDGKYLNFKPGQAAQTDDAVLARLDRIEAKVFGEAEVNHDDF
jgi:hypothetical protein